MFKKIYVAKDLCGLTADERYLWTGHFINHLFKLSPADWQKEYFPDYELTNLYISDITHVCGTEYEVQIRLKDDSYNIIQAGLFVVKVLESCELLDKLISTLKTADTSFPSCLSRAITNQEITIKHYFIRRADSHMLTPVLRSTAKTLKKLAETKTSIITLLSEDPAASKLNPAEIWSSDSLEAFKKLLAESNVDSCTLEEFNKITESVVTLLFNFTTPKENKGLSNKQLGEYAPAIGKILSSFINIYLAFAYESAMDIAENKNVFLTLEQAIRNKLETQFVESNDAFTPEEKYHQGNRLITLTQRIMVFKEDFDANSLLAEWDKQCSLESSLEQKSSTEISNKSLEFR